MLRSLIVVLFLVLYILILGPPFILHALATGSAETLYAVGVTCARWALRLGGIRVRVEGAENVPDGVCLFVANHVSNADPPAIVGSIPRRVALLGKKEVFRVPILSHALLLADFVPVDRSNREAAIASVERAIEHLKKGVSYLIYPEGTRSRDGRLRGFKKGPFVMAIRAGVPIVPVVALGAQRIMRKGSMAVYPGEIIVRFLPVIDASAYTLEQKEELLTHVHAAMAEALPEEQKPLPGENPVATPPARLKGEAGEV